MERLGSSFNTSGAINGLNEQLNIEALLAGTYLLTVTDSIGNIGYLNVALFEPTPILVEAITQEPSCFGALDGSIRLAPSGGQGPYRYAWVGSEASNAERNGLPGGTYPVSVFDGLGCLREATISLGEPPPFVLDYSVTDESCGTPGSGVLVPNAAPRSFSMRVSNLSSGEDILPQAYNTLSAGNYLLEAMDTAGCQFTDTFRVNRPELPAYRLEAEASSIVLGQTTQIRVLAEETATWRWRPSAGTPEFSSAAVQELSPQRTTSYLIDITASSGCTLTDSIRIVVDRAKKTFVPSAF
ncbi:MAG: hypothetical protein HC821_04090, partial [Lewinella sp.]|nr:hypothetical protein [Lewinella sp.]